MKITRYFLLLLPIIILLNGCFKSTNSVNSFDYASVDKSDNLYPVVVIGGGVGGLTSAMYLAQANLDCLVLEGDKIGGALAQSYSVRNWPGIENISGEKLVANIKKHAQDSGAKIISAVAESVDFSQWPYLISIKDLVTGKTRDILALSCIIATGSTPKFLEVPGEREYWGKGVSSCAVCDGGLYRDKVVAVVGGGNTAVHDASYLAALAKKVYIVVRRDQMRAVGKFKDETLGLNNVEVLYNKNIKKILGDGKKVTGVILYDNKKNTEENFKLDAVFLALGSPAPNNFMFKNYLECDEHGYIVLKHDQETSRPGIFAVGDVVNPEFKQAIIAAGEGCVAALQAQKFLSEIGYSIPEKKVGSSPSLGKEISAREKKELHHNVAAEELQEKNGKSKNMKKQEVDDGKVIHVENLKQFESLVKNSSLPVVVDFYAVWCMPCKMMAPIFEELAKKFAGKVRFVKVNIDKIRSLAAEFMIQGVPSFIFIKNGEEVNRITGGRPAEYFERLISTTFDVEK